MLKINPFIMRVCIWSGVLFGVFFFVALFNFAGFIPPPSPELSGQQLIEFYSDQWLLIKMAMPVGILAAGLSLPWTGIIATFIARIEVSLNEMPLLSLTSLACGAANAVLFLLPFIFWSGAYYRADVSPDILRFMNDMTWLEVVMAFSPASVQVLCIAAAGLRDKSDFPVFPRWLCYLMLWIALLYMPGLMGIFFFSGPFSYNGAIVFWVPATVFGVQVLALTYMMLKAEKREKRAE